MSKLSELLNFVRTDETLKVTRSVNARVISDSYKKVESELNSLRQYDRGEKIIDAPDLRSAVQSVQ